MEGHSLDGYSQADCSLPTDFGAELETYSFDWGLEAGGLESGALQSRATEFGAAGPLNRLGATIWGPTISGGLQLDAYSLRLPIFELPAHSPVPKRDKEDP